ncbi:MAG: hypothetical protein GWP59_05995, partial [Chlamydiales bacterium]|nr:hypothetical protein [Chlamydiales bacterium]
RIKQIITTPASSSSTAQLSPTFVLVFTLQEKNTSCEGLKSRTFKDISYFKHEFTLSNSCCKCLKKTYLSTSFTSSDTAYQVLIKLKDSNYYPATSSARQQHLPGIIDFSGKVVFVSDNFKLVAKGVNIFVTIQQHPIN